MALPGRTFDTHIMVGKDGWFVDLTEATNSAAINSSTNITRQPVMGVRDEDAINNSTTHTIEISQIYVGEETDALRRRQSERRPPWVCVFDYNLAQGVAASDRTTGLAYVTDGLLTGVGENAPTSDAIATSLSFPQGSRLFTGYGESKVFRFELTSGAVEAQLANLPSGADVFLIVDETNVSMAKDLEITPDSHAQTLERSVTDEAIWHLGKLTADRTAATIKTDALTGVQTIKGYVLVVEEVDP